MIKAIKGKLTALVIIISATILSLGLLIFLQKALQESHGFIQSRYIFEHTGITTGLAAIFWLLFFGFYWGYLTGELPTEKKVLYRKAIDSLIICWATAITVLIFTYYGFKNNLNMPTVLGNFSLAVFSLGIFITLLISPIKIGFRLEDGLGKLLLVGVSICFGFGFVLLFIYIGKGTVFKPEPAIGNTIIAPVIDFLLWSIVWLLLIKIFLDTKITSQLKLKTFALAFWTSIIAQFIFYVLKFCTFLKPGPLSSSLACWIIFGTLLAISTREYVAKKKTKMSG